MPTYFTLLTPAGLTKVANAQLTNEKVEISQVAVGDGSGTPYQPTGRETALRREVWRGGVLSVEIDSQNPNWIVVEGVIPASVGGFSIREVGLFDTSGTLIAIGNYPDTYKPVIADGSTMDLALRTIIEVNNASSVTLRVDPNVIVASRKFVTDQVEIVNTQLSALDKNTQSVNGKAKMIAHRGLSATYPENTIPAFIGAAKVGMFGVEADFSSTSDGVWVAMHNDTVDASTNGTGAVTSLTYAQIQALTVDSGAGISKYPNLKVPTLDEFLQVCKTHKLFPVIEIKNAADPAHYQTLINTIIKWGFEYNCVILSLRFQPLLDIRALNKSIKLTFNSASDQAEVAAVVRLLAPCMLTFSGVYLNQSAIQYTHSLQTEVISITIDDYAVAQQHASWGADYIVTNRISEVF